MRAYKKGRFCTAQIQTRQGSEAILIGTLENVRLKQGDKIVIATGKAEAEVIDSGDPGKVKIRRLDTGAELWIGRRAILELKA